MRALRTFPLALRSRLAAGLALLLGVSFPARGQLSPAYEEPDLTTPVFDANRLSLEPSIRTRLAGLLAQAVTDYNAELDAKILGVALRLDPASQPAREASARRKRGELPDARRPSQTLSIHTISGYLAGQSSGLRARGGADNIALAGYLNDIAVEIDPDNPVVRYEKTSYRKDYPSPTYPFLKTQPAAAPEALPLLKQQSKIRGLGVTELPNGEETGGVVEMIVTAEAARTRQDMGLTVAQPIGASMRTALDEAARAVKLRHPSFGYRQHLTLSFSEKYGAKDGPSAGAAFTLLLYSLYDPLKLAQDCAITGDITVDGRVRKVGAVPSKIHAALLDGCRAVAIPQENAEAVDDLSLLYPVNTIWKVQIFTVDTLDEAIAVLREDRSANVQRAMELFAGVQKTVGPETPRLGSAQAAVVPVLQEVLRLAPNHASAKFMLRALQGKSPTALSLIASLDEVQRTTQAALRAAAPTAERKEINSRPLTEGIARLEALQPMIDYRLSELCAADLAGLRSVQKLDARQPTPVQLAEYRARMEAVRELGERLSTDRSIIEALRH